MAVADSPTRPAPRQPRPAASRSSTASAEWRPTIAVYVFVVVPLLALLAAVPVAWGWGLGWVDVALAAVFYMVSGLGITVGYHRYFTHGSFKAKRPLRIALALAGSIAMQGPVITWVADHRRHHAFSDKEGDPHSPWLFGTRPARGGPRLLALAHRLAVRARRDQRRSASPPTCSPTATSCASTTRSSLLSAATLLVPAAARRPADLVLVGRADRAVLGRARAGGAAAPRHLVDQLDLPHDRRPALRGPRPLAQRLAARRAELRRVLAQPAPRRPHLRPPRRAARAGRHLRPGDLDLREARLGPPRCAGRRRGVWRSWPPAPERSGGARQGLRDLRDRLRGAAVQVVPGEAEQVPAGPGDRVALAPVSAEARGIDVPGPAVDLDGEPGGRNARSIR